MTRSRMKQLDLLAWEPPPVRRSKRSYLPGLVGSYDIRGDAIAWLEKCWHVSFAHGSELEWAMMSPPFISRNPADVDVILRELVDAGWLKPFDEPKPTFNQAGLYTMGSGSYGLKGLLEQDKSARSRDGGRYREWRFYGFEPIRSCEAYREMVVEGANQ